VDLLIVCFFFFFFFFFYFFSFCFLQSFFFFLISKICPFDFSNDFLIPKICRFDFSNGFLISKICPFDFSNGFWIFKICLFGFGPYAVRPIQFSIFSQSLKNHILCTLRVCCLFLNWQYNVTSIRFSIEWYHSLFDFLFNVDLTIMRSLSGPCVIRPFDFQPKLKIDVNFWFSFLSPPAKSINAYP